MNLRDLVGETSSSVTFEDYDILIENTEDYRIATEDLTILINTLNNVEMRVGVLESFSTEDSSYNELHTSLLLLVGFTQEEIDTDKGGMLSTVKEWLSKAYKFVKVKLKKLMKAFKKLFTSKRTIATKRILSSSKIINTFNNYKPVVENDVVYLTNATIEEAGDLYSVCKVGSMSDLGVTVELREGFTIVDNELVYNCPRTLLLNVGMVTEENQEYLIDYEIVLEALHLYLNESVAAVFNIFDNRGSVADTTYVKHGKNILIDVDDSFLTFMDYGISRETKYAVVDKTKLVSINLKTLRSMLDKTDDVYKKIELFESDFTNVIEKYIPEENIEAINIQVNVLSNIIEGMLKITNQGISDVFMIANKISGKK